MERKRRLYDLTSKVILSFENGEKYVKRCPLRVLKAWKQMVPLVLVENELSVVSCGFYFQCESHSGC